MTLAGQMVRFVVQFGSVILLARLLTPDDFGVVAMVTSVVGIAEIIRDFGLSSAAIQAKTLSQAERSNLWWINTGIGALCTFFIVALAPLLSLVYHDDRVVGIALVLSGLVIVSGANTQPVSYTHLDVYKRQAGGPRPLSAAPSPWPTHGLSWRRNAGRSSRLAIPGVRPRW